MPTQYQIILDVPARRFYERIATRAERAKLDRILQALCMESYVDGETRFAFPLSGVDASLFADGEFWIVYEVPEQATILVLNIGFEEEIPSPERSEPLL